MANCNDSDSCKYGGELGLSQICSKIAQNAFGIFPKFLSIMFFKLPIMLVLCSNMNNIDVKILLLECSIRIFTIRTHVCFILSMNFSAFRML